jgi:hypothetical protein
MDARRWVLLCIGVVGVLKAATAILKPDWFKSFARRWTQAVGTVHTVMGVVVLAAAIALWALVLINQDAVDWALLVLGVLMAWGATLYFQFDQMKKLVAYLVVDRDTMFIRALGIISLLFAAAIVWIAVAR